MKFSAISRKGLFFIVMVIAILGSAFYFSETTKIIASQNKPTWGVSFTKSFAEYLGLDWRNVYLEALDDLGIKRFRIGLNWDEVEMTPGRLNFTDFDWMFDEAEKRNVKIILAVGRKLPRWPECRTPEWAKSLSEEARQERILKYLEESLNHFKNRRTLIAWQIENEPFFRFFGSGCSG